MKSDVGQRPGACAAHTPSWQDIFIKSVALAKLLQDLGPWAGIIAITRGGLVPAAIVSRVLGVRLIDTFCISSYTAHTQGQIQVIKEPSAVCAIGAGWLLIDDIADSGATAREALRILPKSHYAVLYVKPSARSLVNTFVVEVRQDVWIEFPWELNILEEVSTPHD